MPWAIRHESDGDEPWAVVRKETGDIISHHATKRKAQKSIQAMYAHEDNKDMRNHKWFAPRKKG